MDALSSSRGSDQLERDDSTLRSRGRDGAVSSLAKQPPNLPDLDLLATGVAVYPGGRTRHGTPIVIFPAKGHLRLQTGTVTASQLVDIIKFFVSITSPSRRMKGFAFLADFRASTASVFTIIVSAMTSLQRTHAGIIAVFYILMPRHKSLQKALYKQMGIYQKRSFFSFGRKKKTLPVSELPHILLHSAVELHEHVAEDQLPSDFAGTLPYSHSDWIHFYKLMEANIDGVREVERRMGETEERLAELQDVPLPDSPAAAEESLGRMRSVYEDSIEYLGINQAVDETTHLLGICTAPERHASFLSMAGNPHWEEYRTMLNNMMEKLLEDRRFLQSLWKTASSRVEYARQFNEYKKQTGEALKWIQDVGQPILRHPLKIAESLDEAETNRKNFMDHVYQKALIALNNADKCVNKADGLAQVVASADADAPIHFSQDTTRFLEGFRKELEKRRVDYDNLYNFYLTVGRLVRWYRRTLRHLPVQLAPKLSDNDVPTTRVAFSPQWDKMVHSYSLRHPPPKSDHLNRIKESLTLLPPKPIKHQARLLIHRLQLLMKVIEKDISVAEFREVLDLKQRSEKGLHDSALKASSGASVSSLNLLGQTPKSGESLATTPINGQRGKRSALNDLRRRRLEESHVERFLNDQVMPIRQSYTLDSGGGYSAPGEDPLCSMDHINMIRAHSEHEFPMSRSSYVPPKALYRPVSLAAMTGSQIMPWDANIRQEERRQNDFVLREMQRRQALLSDAERSLRDSSSYMNEIETEQTPHRQPKKKERRGVRSVKKKDSKRLLPSHHASEPNIHYDWDDPPVELDGDDDDENFEFDWALDNERSLSELEAVLNHMASDKPNIEILPDTHIGNPGRDPRRQPIMQPAMRVRRYDRDTPSSRVSSFNSDAGHLLASPNSPRRASGPKPHYPSYSKQMDNVMMF